MISVAFSDLFKVICGLKGSVITSGGENLLYVFDAALTLPRFQNKL